jgi:hypothetical protein
MLTLVIPASSKTLSLERVKTSSIGVMTSLTVLLAAAKGNVRPSILNNIGAHTYSFRSSTARILRGAKDTVSDLGSRDLDVCTHIVTSSSLKLSVPTC